MFVKYLVLASLCSSLLVNGKYVFPIGSDPCNRHEQRVNGICRALGEGVQRRLGVNGFVNIRSKRQAISRYPIADETLTVGFLPWLQRDTNNLTPPVTYYQIGPNNRTEVMSAFITINHLGTGTETTTRARRFARSMGYSNDQAGHILARRLGGSGSDLRNIIPQGREFNAGAWAGAEGVVADLVRNNPAGIRFTVNLEYRDRQATRPYLIVYQAEQNGRNVITGDVANP